MYETTVGRIIKKAMKAQLLVEFETDQIICTDVNQGRTHDFKLLKRNCLPFVASQMCLADRGYQGFDKQHKRLAETESK